MIAEHADGRMGHKTAKATIRLPLDRQIPAALVSKLMAARALEI